MKVLNYLKYFKKIRVFDDIYLITKTLSKKKKGNLFEILTFYLFKFVPALNQNLQEIWLYDDMPTKILDKLNLPSTDKGIDLIAKKDDNYYAIQCKFRQNNEKTISWDVLSTFYGLTFGVGTNIKGGYLVTNTFDLCDEVIKSNKVIPIYGDYFTNNLSTNFFENICLDLQKKEVKTYVPRSPFNFQEDCVKNVIEELKKNFRCHIEMACGSGKTLTSYWIDKVINFVIFFINIVSIGIN